MLNPLYRMGTINAKRFSLKIINFSGFREIPVTENIRLDLTKIIPGTYFIKIISNNEVKIEKIIKI